MIVGNGSGTFQTTLYGDELYVVEVTMPEDGQVVKLSALVEGGDADQVLRAALYGSDLALLATSGEVALPASAAQAWVDFDFLDDLPEGAEVASGDDLYLVVQAGPTSGGTLYGVTASGGLRAGGVYADGPPATLVVL